jgi:class 3 adenylate cyclase
MRALLPAIHVPTLVCYREGSFGADHARYVADNIDGARCVVLGGDDYWWFLGDCASLLDVIEDFVTGGHAEPAADRMLATVMFSDIVHSTEQIARMGDRRWRELLTAHDGIVHSEVDRWRGREVKWTGDGFLATFDGPGRALHCAWSVRDAVRSLDLDLRIGVHAGEIELHGDDIAGLAVSIAQRIQAAAEPGEILASRTVVDLVAGSGIGFTDRGTHNLKGVPSDWQLYALEAGHPPHQL